MKPLDIFKMMFKKDESKPEYFDYSHGGRIKLNKAAIIELVNSDKFKAQIKAAEQIRIRYEKEQEDIKNNGKR